MNLRISRSPSKQSAVTCHEAGRQRLRRRLGPAERTNIGNLSSAAKQTLSKNDKNQTENRARVHRNRVKVTQLTAETWDKDIKQNEGFKAV